MSARDLITYDCDGGAKVNDLRQNELCAKSYVKIQSSQSRIDATRMQQGGLFESWSVLEPPRVTPYIGKKVEGSRLTLSKTAWRLISFRVSAGT